MPTEESNWKLDLSYLTYLLITQPMKSRSVQYSSVAQSCLTLCDPMDCSTPGLPVRHQLSEFTQAHVHWASDAIQPSHPLSSPSPPAFNPFQNQDSCLLKPSQISFPLPGGDLYLNYYNFRLLITNNCWCWINYFFFSEEISSNLFVLGQ